MSIGRNGFSIKRMMAIMIMLLLSLNVLGNLIPLQQVEAKTWTKSQIKKEITKTDAKIKSVKTKYNKAKKALEKVQKGTVSVFGATIVSYNPLVVYFQGVLGHNRGYYWIESGTENFSTLFGTGTFKLTGKYRDYGDVTCAVAKGVKLPAGKVDKLGKKLDKLRSKKAALKHSLVNKATLYAKYMYEDYSDGKSYLLAGKDYDIYDATCWTYSDEYYSYADYKSSDNSIASVDGGVLTAKKSGTVTITVISSISKKKTKTKLVIKESGEIQKNNSSSSTEELEDEVEQKNDSSSSTEELEDEAEQKNDSSSSAEELEDEVDEDW